MRAVIVCGLHNKRSVRCVFMTIDHRFLHIVLMLLQKRYHYCGNLGVCCYRSRGIIVMILPSLWYYRRIFPIPMVITVVTTVLPYSPIPCHALVCIYVSFASRCFTKMEDANNATRWPRESCFLMAKIFVSF